MKLPRLILSLLALAVAAAHAAELKTDLTLGGTANFLKATAVFTVQSGATLTNTGTINGAGAFNFASGTVVLPATVTRGAATLTLPTTTSTLATLALAETFTNKTISLASNTLSATSAQLAAAVSDETGTGAAVFATSPTLVTPVLGVATATSVNGTTIPSSKTLVVTTDTLAVHAATTSAQLAGVLSDETGTGAVVLATSPTLVTPALGTPSAVVLTSATGLPLTSGVTGTLPVANGGTGITSLGTGVATWWGTPTSANFAAAITDETGTGSVVLATSPTLVTPVLGVATATSVNGTTIPSSKTLVVTTDTLAVHAATTSAQLAGVISDETGTGSVVLATSPTLVTPALGTPTAVVLTSGTGLPLTTGVTGTLPVANGGTGITSLGTGVATWLGTPSSASLLAAVTDETGTGALVFANTPTLVTPNIGAATGTSLALSGAVTASGTGTHTFGTTNTVTMAAGNLTASGTITTNTGLAFGALSNARSTMQGVGGGWDNRYHFKGSAGTDLGGFGGFGTTDALTHFYVGPSAGSTYAAFSPTATTLAGNLTVSGTGTSTINSANIDFTAPSATQGTYNFSGNNTSTSTATTSGGVRIKLKNVDATVNNFTFISNESANGNQSAGIAFVNAAHTAGAPTGFIEFLARTNPGSLSTVGTAKTTGWTILGTTTNDNAATGYVGEYVSSTLASGSAVSLTSSVISNVTSISLTAGDWDVDGLVAYILGASTTTTGFTQGITTTSATFGALGSYIILSVATANTGFEQTLIAPTTRISISATTTVYLIARASFAVSTASAYGTIRARRVR